MKTPVTCGEGAAGRTVSAGFSMFLVIRLCGPANLPITAGRVF